MPKVHHVKKSRKPVPQLDLPAGSEYYWWGLMQGSRGVKRFSKTYPTRSQLTQSEFLGRLYDLEDQLADIENPDDLDCIIEEIRSLGEEQQEKADNQPENLHGSSGHELLENRASAMEAWADELDGVEAPEEPTEDEINDEMEDEEEGADRDEVKERMIAERLEEFKEAVQNCTHDAE